MRASTTAPGHALTDRRGRRNRISISISGLLAVEGAEAPGDPHVLVAALRKKLTFLPEPQTVKVAGDSLAIGYYFR